MNFNWCALYSLTERECFRLQQQVKTFKGKKFVLFPAGPTSQAFYGNLLNNYGIEAECFIDNNTELTGKLICGKPVLYAPWEKNPDFKSEYVALIPTLAKHYFQIAEQLNINDISYMYASAFCACQLWERYKAVLEIFEDDLSRMSYLAAIYGLCTCDYGFIQCMDNHYFALKNFVENGFQIIADVGAYVGDTVEEYVKRNGTEHVKIYAFEPSKKARAALEIRVQRLKNEWMLKDEDIVIVDTGVGAKTEQIAFSHANLNTFKPDEFGSVELPVYSLDDYFKDKEPFTLLKADIEGGEMDMLLGAKNIIQKVKPKMTLCIYHSPEDFVRIIEYVRLLIPEYHFAVRNHYPDYRDTILYCWI